VSQLGDRADLRRLDVHIPDGSDLSRGKASKLINAAKAQN